MVETPPNLGTKETQLASNWEPFNLGSTISAKEPHAASYARHPLAFLQDSPHPGITISRIERLQPMRGCCLVFLYGFEMFYIVYHVSPTSGQAAAADALLS